MRTKVSKIAEKIVPRAAGRDPRLPWKWALGVLAGLNLFALLFIYRPFGGSVSGLESELDQLNRQTLARQATLARSRGMLEKVKKATTEHDEFLGKYFMDRRTTSSTILTEIGTAAAKAGFKPKEHAFQIDEVEGSDTISMMTVTANYEGTYADLVEFVHIVDQSPRFLIIDSIAAAPQQTPGMLNARFKIHAFIREKAPTTGAAALLINNGVAGAAP